MALVLKELSGFSIGDILTPLNLPYRRQDAADTVIKLNASPKTKSRFGHR